MSNRAVPAGGPLLTRTTRILLLLLGLGGIMTIWRFVAGIGATSALNDGYPWGIWIAFDVVSGTALACGGYAVAIMVYILNKGRYHPLVRPAVLTSALGYSVASIAIVIDVGRYWNLYKLPFAWNNWNLNSALLEVALCVMSYIVVLWLEMAPAFLEKWRDGQPGRLQKLARAVHPVIDRFMIIILALGLLLPTMHQSSLGTVMMLAGHKLNPLWRTPFLPLLFLLSCIAMGYGVVVMESSLSSRFFHRKSETPMLGNLGKVMAWIIFAYAGLRLADLAIRGQLGHLFAGSATIWFILEMALFLVPAVMLLSPRVRRDPGSLFRAAFLIVLAGIMYRFTTYLVAYNPGPGWAYFPSVPEMFITVGIVSLEIIAYIFIVKRFPILAGAAEPARPTEGVAR